MVYDNSDLEGDVNKKDETMCKHADNYVCWSAVFKQKNVLKFVTKVNIVTPYISPYGYPYNVPVGQKSI